MKNKELIIVTMVILVIIIIGLIIVLCFGLSGKHNFGIGGVKKSDQTIFDASYEIAEINDLEVLSTAGNIDFQESTDGKIRVVVYGQNEEDLKVSLNENQLKVDYSQYRQKSAFFGWNVYMNDMIIYLPKSYAKEIKIKANYGDINITDLENATIHIEEDCGNVSLGKVKNAFIENSYGDVKIESILNKAEIELSCGNVKINSMTILEDSSIINNFGDIKIGQTNEIYIDAKTDLGDMKVNQNNRKSEITLKLKNDCGSIKVEN